MSSATQIIRQIEYLVETATWEDSPSQLVIGNTCEIAPDISEDFQLPGRVPFALLNAGDFAEDDDDPTLGVQTFYLVLATAVQGSPTGAFSLTGGSGRETGKSGSRGVLEIQRPILNNLANLYGADGNVAKITPGSAGGAQWRDGLMLAWRQYVIAVMCTVEDEYPAPSHLVATGGSGQVALTWDLPPARWDLDAIVLRYASGATAPASVTAGTGVTLASDLATSKTVTGLASGSYSFAVFARYNDVNTGDYHYSAQDTGSFRVSVSVT